MKVKRRRKRCEMRREAKSQQRKKVKMHKMQFVEVQTVRVLMGRSSFMKRKEVLKFQTSAKNTSVSTPHHALTWSPAPRSVARAAAPCCREDTLVFFILHSFLFNRFYFFLLPTLELLQAAPTRFCSFWKWLNVFRFHILKQSKFNLVGYLHVRSLKMPSICYNPKKMFHSYLLFQKMFKWFYI